MKATTHNMSELNKSKIENFAGQVIGDLSASMSGVLVQIGLELGLYKAMEELGDTDATELATKTDTYPRYIQEWLNNQAAGGYIDYDMTTKKYRLSPEHAIILANEASPFYMTPGFNVVSSMWMDKDKIIGDFKEGKGIGWHEHHHSLFFGTEAFFRAGYRANLVNDWIPSLTDIDGILHKGGKVADIGCGHGASTIIMASHYPNSTFFGYDNHKESVEIACKRAKDAGLNNVFFEVANANNYSGSEFDLICFMDSFHDFGDPLTAIKHSKSKLTQNGSIMLVEPASFDNLEENFNPIGRMFFAASTTLCVPHSNSEAGQYCLGAQAGPKRVGQIVDEAGYSTFKIAKRTPVNLIYEIKI